MVYEVLYWGFSFPDIASCWGISTMSWTCIGSIPFPMRMRYSAKLWSCNDRMFCCKCSIFVLLHKWELIIQVEIICAFVSFWTTDSTWCKSPHSMITFPPNGASESRMSFNYRSSASNTYLLIMGVSSQIIAFAVFISFARSGCLLIEQN